MFFFQNFYLLLLFSSGSFGSLSSNHNIGRTTFYFNENDAEGDLIEQAFTKRCSDVTSFWAPIRPMQEQLKMAHFNSLIVSPGYDIAHVYPQSKIAENVNSYLTSNSMPNLRALTENLFTFDPDAYVYDLDQREEGVDNTNGNFYAAPLKYSNEYINRNQPTTDNLETTNSDWKSRVEDYITKFTENGGVLSSNNYKDLLARMCWAPANLRFGRSKTNFDIGNSLDPMGDEVGLMTNQELWFRELGNLVWGSEICEDEGFQFRCRPASSSQYRYPTKPDPYRSYVFCESLDYC